MRERRAPGPFVARIQPRAGIQEHVSLDGALFFRAEALRVWPLAAGYSMQYCRRTRRHIAVFQEETQTANVAAAAAFV
jgi:hypothetical protein